MIQIRRNNRLDNPRNKRYKDIDFSISCDVFLSSVQVTSKSFGFTAIQFNGRNQESIE